MNESTRFVKITNPVNDRICETKSFANLDATMFFIRSAGYTMPVREGGYIKYWFDPTNMNKAEIFTSADLMASDPTLLEAWR